MTTADFNKDNKRKFSIGEELYQIYLKRRIVEEEERDEVPVTKRKRSRSIGDELYAVHLKRSQGTHHDSHLCADMNSPNNQKDATELQEDKNVTQPSPVSP
mmetsp:Transcript_13233/g.19292  ORF Transcript_13233/g.19292 Transcript_13233/m.19292 type:complete len:101 (+) Transcript_13233:19-321(+)